tara:strand:+ start:1713 stop:1943 length:231 start_codon:yes stop_codon:yes gene_type:complete
MAKNFFLNLFVLTIDISRSFARFKFLAFWQPKSAKKLIDQQLLITCEKVYTFFDFFSWFQLVFSSKGINPICNKII